MRVRRWHGLLAALLAGASGVALAAKPDPDKLNPMVVRDLHYGDVLFYFYQGDDFEALTRLNSYKQWGRTPNHEAESELLLGGLYLSLGMHNEAGRRFERLLAQNVPMNVRNRAWFYLGKIWYSRGYLDRAERAIAAIQGQLTPDLEAERMHLLANVLMRQERFDDAIQLLNGWRARDGQRDWLAYAEFNLGVALVRKGLVAEADPILTRVGTMETNRREMRALRDRANLALGFAYLQSDQAANARVPLERVRLNGPYSTKALLGVGWADAATGDFEKALTPWLELRDRNLLDAAVQESYLAIPYAFRKLGAEAQAAESYEVALQNFEKESASLDVSIKNIENNQLMDQLVSKEDREQYGWFWQLRQVPDAAEARYLYTLLASHDFQEGLKNYRDLGFMGLTLDRWNDSVAAFDNMIDTRERAYAERLPPADALLASGAADAMRGKRDMLSSELDRIEQANDFAALGSAEQRDQWERIQRIEAGLATAPSDEENNELREKARLVKGVLQWRLAESFKARVYNQRRTIRDLDQALREAENRWVRVQKARASAPTNTDAFNTRLATLKDRLDVLTVRLVDMQARQNNLLERLAINELTAQKERLATYQVQARFELASIYDKVANPPAAPRGERSESQEGSESAPQIQPESVEPQAPSDGATESPPPSTSNNTGLRP
jgi:lipopolysaccharide biosynthesis regulator YciM